MSLNDHLARMSAMLSSFKNVTQFYQRNVIKGISFKELSKAEIKPDMLHRHHGRWEKPPHPSTFFHLPARAALKRQPSFKLIEFSLVRFPNSLVFGKVGCGTWLEFSWQHFEIYISNQDSCTVHPQIFLWLEIFICDFFITCTKTETGPQSSSVIIWCFSALSMVSHSLLLASRHNTCTLESIQQGRYHFTWLSSGNTWALVSVLPIVTMVT